MKTPYLLVKWYKLKKTRRIQGCTQEKGYKCEDFVLNLYICGRLDQYAKNELGNFNKT